MKKPDKELCKNDKNILVRVKWPMWYKISKQALDEGVTRNALLTKCFEEYFERLEKKDVTE